MFFLHFLSYCFMANRNHCAACITPECPRYSTKLHLILSGLRSLPSSRCYLPLPEAFGSFSARQRLNLRHQLSSKDVPRKSAHRVCFLFPNSFRNHSWSSAILKSLLAKLFDLKSWNVLSNVVYFSPWFLGLLCHLPCTQKEAPTVEQVWWWPYCCQD